MEAAVYLHGLAADLAVREGDEHTLLATDSLVQLAPAFHSHAHTLHSEGRNGYVWLQGALYAADSSARQASARAE